MDGSTLGALLWTPRDGCVTTKVLSWIIVVLKYTILGQKILCVDQRWATKK